MTRRRLLAPLFGAGILLLALTACDPPGPATPSASPTGSPTSTSSSTPTATPTDDSPDADGSAPCTRDSLTNEFEFTDGTAGQLHGILTVGNMSGATCRLTGYPTLYVGEPEAEGVMGAAATHDEQDPGSPIELAPGDAAVAHVTLTEGGNVDGCTIVDTDYFVYAPPGVAFDIETSAQHIYSTPFPGCRNDDIALVMVGGFSTG
jgi:hypothetical protein